MAIQVKDETEAKVLAAAIKEGRIPAEQREAAMLALRTFVASQNPGVDVTPNDVNKWTEANIDRSPLPGSSAIPTFRAHQVSQLKEGGPVREERTLNPEEPDARRRQAAQSGIDFTTGASFGQRARLALGFNAPQNKAIMLHAVLQDMGMPSKEELPPGFVPIRRDPDLGEWVFLRKQDNGKYRWTTVDETGFAPEDIADMLDLQEGLATAGAVLGATATKGGVFGEALGDILGRSTGLAFELLINSGQVTPEVAAAELKNAGFDSAANLVLSRVTQKVAGSVSRGVGRAGAGQRAGRSTFGTDFDVAEAEIAFRNAAEDTREVAAVAGRNLELTPGEVTGDITRLTREASETTRLPSKVRNEVRIVKRQNLDTLVEYVNNTHPRGVNYNPGAAVDSYRRALEAERLGVEASLSRVGQVKTIPTNSPGSYRYKVEGAPGSTMDAIPINNPRTGEPARMITRAQSPEVVDETTGDFVRVGQAMYKEYIDHASRDNVTAFSDRALSDESAHVWQSLQKQGYELRIAGQDGYTVTDMLMGDVPNVTKSGDGYWRANNGDPLIEVVGLPREARQNAIESLPDRFRSEQLEMQLEDLSGNLNYLTAQRNKAVENIQLHVGWNPQTQKSRYAVNNTLRGTNLGKAVERLMEQSERAIARGEAAPADRLISDLFRSEDTANLAAPQLDVYQLAKTRDRLREANDPLANEVAAAMDSLLKNAKWIDVTNNAADTVAARARFVELDRDALQMDTLAHEAAGILQGNAMLRRGRDGKLMNTSVEALDRMTRNSAAKLGDLREAVGRDPGLTGELRLGLWEVYRKRTGIDKGTFSMAAHETFMRERSEAMDLLFGPEDARLLARNPSRFRLEASKTEERLKQLREIVSRNTEQFSARDERILSTSGIYRSLRKMTPTERSRVLTRLEQLDPRAAINLRRHGQEEIRLELVQMVKSGNMPAMDKWLATNRDTLRELYGARYVADLDRLGRSLRMATRHEHGVPPDRQPDWLMISRTSIGPLTRPQRFLSAITLRQQRAMARNVLRIISSPEDLRRFTIVGDKLDPYSRAGVMVMSRLGLFDGLGFDDDPDKAAKQLQMLLTELSLEGETPEEGQVESKGQKRSVPSPTPEPPGRQGSNITPVLPGRGSLMERRAQSIRNSEEDLREMNRGGR